MAWTRGQVYDIITEQASKNPKYRDTLLKDPRMVLSKQLGTDLPASMKIEVLQETADKIFVVLPYVPKEGAELKDEELEKVAGGFADKICVNSTIATQVNFNF